MTDHAVSHPRARSARLVPALLIVSLALNLIVIGLFAGAFWRYRSGGYLPSQVTPNLLGYVSTLPTPRRNEVWAKTAEERQLIRPLRRELRNVRDEVIGVLEAEPFDRARFDAAQARLLQVDERAREAVYKLYSQIAANLTSEERRAFRDWREKRRPPGGNLLDEPDQQANDRQKTEPQKR
jgi:uncharacterized membrane protein